jgi:hypothetical protein
MRARLYRADAGISNIVTAERRVHGASSGTQEFMAVYELLNPDIGYCAHSYENRR